MMQRTACGLLVLVVLTHLAGCGTPSRMQSAERYRNGVVYVLPGIEGKSIWNRDIALGLDEGGVRAAIEVYDWTIGVPGVYNLIDLERNRRAAAALAARIVEQRRRHPGAPVHLVGHSGGGGVAVLTLEALPPPHQVDLVILLAPALSPDYDLSEALSRVRIGLVNFYSRYDIGFLGVGTTVFGSIDRDLGASAGAVGFRRPPELAPEARDLYIQRLRQVGWTARLRSLGASGTHFGWASRRFAANYLARLIREEDRRRPSAVEKAPASDPAAADSVRIPPQRVP